MDHLLFFLCENLRGRGAPGLMQASDARRMLTEQFAQGKITIDNWRAMTAALGDPGPGPSEAPRRLAGNAADWRSWMPASHAAVRDLVGRGRVVVTQKGSVVDVKTVRGPYRVRLVSS